MEKGQSMGKARLEGTNYPKNIPANEGGTPAGEAPKMPFKTMTDPEETSQEGIGGNYSGSNVSPE